MPDQLWLLDNTPNVRQENHWECGAAATHGVCLLYGVGPKSLAETAEALGTNEARSTDPKRIVSLLSGLGLTVEARAGLAVTDLAEYTSRGWPVIAPVQDYVGQRSPKAVFLYGHYLTVLAVALGRVIVQDSALQNAERIAGGDISAAQADPDRSIGEPGRKPIRDADWLANWHDEDDQGVRYLQFGIAVGPPPEKEDAMAAALAFNSGRNIARIVAAITSMNRRAA